MMRSILLSKIPTVCLFNKVPVFWNSSSFQLKMLLTCSHCAHFLQIREVMKRLTWSFGRNKIPISYERIISCWPFFSSVPQAAFDKLALQRKKLVYKIRWEVSRNVWVPSICDDKSSLGEQLVRPYASHGATRTNDELHFGKSSLKHSKR